MAQFELEIQSFHMCPFNPDILNAPAVCVHVHINIHVKTTFGLRCHFYNDCCDGNLKN
jgi:hypothetical protein